MKNGEAVLKCLITKSYIITLAPAIIRIWDKTTFLLKKRIEIEPLLLTYECQINLLKASEYNNFLFITTDVETDEEITDEEECTISFKVNMNEDFDDWDEDEKIIEGMFIVVDFVGKLVFLKDRGDVSVYDLSCEDQLWTKVAIQVPSSFRMNYPCRSVTNDYHFFRNTN